MLVERWHESGFLTLVSPKLSAMGVPHGFTTAVGRGGARWGVRMAADLAELLREEGLGDRRLLMGRQVHGASVSTADSRRGAGCDGFDAHVTAEAGELVSVRTADCVPVLLSVGEGAVVAAVHAGWRGLRDGVMGAAVSAARREGGAGRLVAAVGPCIGVAAYEVGEEVASQFSHGVVRRSAWARPHLDLRALAMRALLEAGVPAEDLDVATQCTFAEAAWFGSYRREGRGCGHQAGYIGPAAR